MSDILDMSDLGPALSAVAKAMSKLHISALSISLLANGKQARVSGLTTDGRCHYVVKTTNGSTEWVSYDTGVKSDWTR